MNTEGERKISWQEQVWVFLEGSILWLFIIVLTLSISIILSLNTSLTPQVDVTMGQPSLAQIVAPQSIIFESEELTRIAREQAAADIEDVYDSPSVTIGRTQTDLARATFAFVDNVRADALASQATKINYLQAITAIRLEDEVAEDLVALSDEAYGTAKSEVLRIIQVVMRSAISDVDLTDARRRARLEASFDLLPAQERVVTTLAPQFIVPNSFYNAEQTQANRQAAADAVSPVMQQVRQGEMIVRTGELVTQEHLEILAELGLLQPQRHWQDYMSIFTASLIAVMLITLYWQEFHPRLREIIRYWFLFGLVILLYVLLARFMIPGRTTLAYIFPAAALSLLFAVIFDKRLALIVTIILALIVGLVANNSLVMTAYTTLGGFLAVLTLKDTLRINAIFRAGLMAGDLVEVRLF